MEIKCDVLSKVKLSRILDPFAKFFLHLGLSPNQITIIGFSLGLIASYTLAIGHFSLGGFLIMICGFFDALDGAVARLSARVTPFGGILDSTLDRIVDALLLIGIGASNAVDWLPIALAITLSFLVSYIRARSEATGMIKKLDVGIAERAERMLILAVGLIVGFIKEAVFLLILLSLITVIWRLIQAKRLIEKIENI
ncbi:MAG: CDP-alcohol phosphatidyltransferase family protein [Methanocellales archaeon]